MTVKLKADKAPCPSLVSFQPAWPTARIGKGRFTQNKMADQKEAMDVHLKTTAKEDF